LVLFRTCSETKCKLNADYGYTDGVASSHMFTKSNNTQQSEAHASCSERDVNYPPVQINIWRNKRFVN